MKNPISKKDKKKKKRSDRVFRGGGWYYEARYVRVSNRVRDEPSGRDLDLGFRIVRTKKNEKSNI